MHQKCLSPFISPSPRPRWCRPCKHRNPPAPSPKKCQMDSTIWANDSTITDLFILIQSMFHDPCEQLLKHILKPSPLKTPALLYANAQLLSRLPKTWSLTQWMRSWHVEDSSVTSFGGFDAKKLIAVDKIRRRSSYVCTYLVYDTCN